MRVIDADAFFNDFPEIRDYEYASQEYEIDAKPVKHGRWEKNEEGDYHCSECKAIVESEERYWHYWRYCYNCGATMDEVIEI